MTDFTSVQNKVAIVTGASDGLGKAIAMCYAENGMKVIVSDINAEKGSKVVEEIKAAGGEASFFQTDVSQGKM